MGFFERNRAELAERGIDPGRLPPGQYFTERFPVLHAGEVPDYPDLSVWSLSLFGEVDRPLSLSFDELRAMLPSSVTVDIHCVTKWSKFDTTWTGVRVDELMAAARVRPTATHLVAHGEYGYTTNLPLADVTGDRVALVAYEYGGEPLAPEHGYPARLLVPHLYFWKSAKWLRGLEFVVGDRPGFWEQNGYHLYGDPWREQRFWGD